MTAAPLRRAPVSTYRLQLHAEFPFAAAREVVPYLARLGITDCYLSPIFAARRGSPHGYDVTDHNAVNPALGGAEGYDKLSAALVGAGMGQLLDIVPNHMGVDAASNPWWRDLLENGLCSIGARFFDIDWTPVKPELEGRVLLPILGDQYGQVLERGELRLRYADGSLELRYVDTSLPINPRQIPRVLRHNVDALRAELEADDPQVQELLGIIASLASIPAFREATPAAIAERRREKDAARDRLVRLVERSPRIRRHIDEALTAMNGEPGRPSSFDALHELLEAQPYRLAYWRTAAHEINYRRFFDINELAGLRVEDPEVFEATHRLLLELLRRGHVTGVRVDHPDGLFDPASYFEMLQGLAARAWNVDRAEGTPGPLYVVAEKILAPGETLPAGWPVHGTTGYTFLNEINGLFVHESAARRLRRAYTRFTGLRWSFDDVVYECKKLIMDTSLASELNVLAHAVDRIGERNRRARDFTVNSIRDALAEVVASFPVYRTYVAHGGWTVEDRKTISTAIRRSRRRNPALEASVFDFLREVLLPREVNDPAPPDEDSYPDERRMGYPPATEEERRERLRVSMKFQQYTAPVQAKGVEDTAFYRYNVLLALNEVGGEPSQSGVSAAAFHAANRRRRDRYPFELNATATHDTKLGEDVRARLSVLSELPEDWARALSRWRRANKAHRTIVDGEPAPDKNDEYRFYQALVGIWPAAAPPTASGELVARMREYMNKSIKEAKIHTSWLNEHRAYDAATASFVEHALSGPGGARFLPLFLPFARRIARQGVVNSLAQVALKLASPGVPDVYQGTELWDLSLVDPDNRRPVDFEARARLLDGLAPLLACPEPGRGACPEPGRGGCDPAAARARGVADLLDAWPDARVKLFVTACGLRLRRDAPDVFLRGEYVPLDAEVTVPAGLIAFARTLDDRAIIVVAPRLTASLSAPDHPFPIGPECWKTSRVLLPDALAARRYRNVFTAEFLEPTRTATQAWIFAGDALRVLPSAILVSL